MANCRFNRKLRNVENITHQNVGAGLPAMAVHQAEICGLTDRYRRQASSHRRSVVQGLNTRQHCRITRAPNVIHGDTLDQPQIFLADQFNVITVLHQIM